MNNTQITKMAGEAVESWPEKLSKIEPKNKVYVSEDDARSVQAIIYSRMKKKFPERQFVTQKVKLVENGETIPYLEIERTA